MRIPHDRLSPDALCGLIEEYVTRDGTELTEADVKTAQVRAAIERGALAIVYDEDSGSCNVVPADELGALSGDDGD